MGSGKKYDKVVGFGHSLGSATLNYAAIGDGADSPFDGLVLTGMSFEWLLGRAIDAKYPRDDPRPPVSSPQADGRCAC